MPSMKRPSNIHPGEVLLEEFLPLMGISHNVLAQAIGVPPRCIDEIVLGKRAITADTGACGSPRISTPRNLSGKACKLITIWRGGENGTGCRAGHAQRLVA